MVLGKIITSTSVGFAGSPVKIELLLGNAILQPMISHVKSFGLFHANLGMKNTVSRRVVGFKESASRRLFRTHFFESSNHGNSLLGVEKEAAGFGFGGGCGGGANGLAKNMDGTIGLWIRRRAGSGGKGCKEKMACSTAASIRKDKVGGIGGYSKDHVAGIIANGSIGMRGEIVKKHVAGLFGVLGWRCLSIGDFVRRNNDGRVTAAGIGEKEAGDLLDTFDAEFVEERRDIIVGKLNLLAIDGSCPAMGRVLRLGGQGMTQCEKGFGHIVWHRDVNIAGVVVPVDLETEVTGPGPVFRQRIFGGKGVEEMSSIGLSEEFDTEIVNGKCESGATIDVAPKTRGLRDRKVTKRSKVGLELIISKNGSLFEAMHAFADLDIEVPFGVKIIVGQIVLANNFGSEIAAMDPHVLIDKHVGEEGEVFQVTGAVAGAEVSIGDDTVEVELAWCQ